LCCSSSHSGRKSSHRRRDVIVVVLAVVVTEKEELAVANSWITCTTWVAKDVTHSMLRISKHEVVA
jgi:hypothetical protein